MHSEAALKEKLSSTLNGVEHVSVVDVTDGCGAKFEAIIVAKEFEGMPLLKRHRRVNEILEAELKDIHAWSMKTWTPEQYKEKKWSFLYHFNFCAEIKRTLNNKGADINNSNPY